MSEAFFDSHCHLMDPGFSGDLEAILDRSRNAGVERLLLIGTDVNTSQRAAHLAREHDNLYASVGIAPHEAANAQPGDLEQIRALARQPEVVALGEIGLEYHHDVAPKPLQHRFLRDQLQLSHELDLPVIFHHRNAESDFRLIVESEGVPRAGGVMHCFTADSDMLRWAVGRRLFISFAGMITFKSAETLRQRLRETPLDRLLLETDAPYLAPEPYRGKRCEPSMLIETARTAAELKGLSVDDIARITRHNALRLFRLPDLNPARIVYPIGRSLYLNITNQCPNHCEFCIRFQGRELKGHRLALDHEPPLPEVMDALRAWPLELYDEIVFCGFGEPTCRMDVLLEVAEYLQLRQQRVRLNTNGLGNLINCCDIVPDLVGKVDAVSVSLNTPNAEQYQKLCHSEFGEEAWHAMTLFVQKCKAENLETRVTVLDLPEVDVEACQHLADKMGVPLRRRSFVHSSDNAEH